MLRAEHALRFSLCVLLGGLAACGEADPEFEANEESLTTTVALGNPGFESDFSGWTQVEPASISSVRHSGTKSAKMSSSSGGVKRTVSGLTGGQSYTLSAWVLGSATVGARSFGGTEVKVTKTASSWTQVSVTFTVA